MESLPSMWRTEMMHPLFVHFPIALLLFASIVLIIARLNLFPSYGKTIYRAGLFMLFPGVVLAWVSVYTGIQADGVVGREVCDPTVLEDHERFAFFAAYLFTGAAVVEGARLFFSLKAWWKKIRKALSIALVVVYLGGAAGIGYVGHLGARLVYQQAAAVHQPSEDCSEFE